MAKDAAVEEEKVVTQPEPGAEATETLDQEYDIQEPGEEDVDTSGEEDGDKTAAADDKDTGGDGKPAGEAGADSDAPLIPVWQQKRAERLGLDAETVQKYHKAGVLADTIERFEALQTQLPKTAKPDADKAARDGADEDGEFKPLELPENLSEWDDDFAGVVKSMYEGFNERLKQLHTANRALTQQLAAGPATSEQARQAATIESAFDNAVNAFVDGKKPFAAIFGKGTASDLDRNSDLFKNRSELFDAVMTLHAGMQARGGQPLSMDKLVEKAINAEFSEYVTQAAQQKKAETAASRQAKHLNRPSHRNTSPTDRLERAAGAARAKFEEHGLPADDESMDEQF